ncbi:hypothetical protein CaCOL14_005197 [Colletotrichum acutatum]
MCGQTFIIRAHRLLYIGHGVLFRFPVYVVGKPRRCAVELSDPAVTLISGVSLRSEDVLWCKGGRIVPLQEMQLVSLLSRHRVAPSLDAVDKDLCCVV